MKGFRDGNNAPIMSMLAEPVCPECKTSTMRFTNSIYCSARILSGFSTLFICARLDEVSSSIASLNLLYPAPPTLPQYYADLYYHQQ